ncbi:MAG: DUF6132 family protein [Prolixibacteraceae bacterium]|jgi:hypothetical protein|nr:DUF6132 family protein [Prolixibacteraceae bacterium]
MENNTNTEPKELTLKGLLSKWTFWKPLVAIAIGGTLGFLNYYYVGCTSGSCGITSNPYLSIAFGGFMGLFVVNSPCAKGKC